MIKPEIDMNVKIKGTISLSVVRPDNTIRYKCVSGNITCTAGLTAIAASLVWSGVQDQSSTLGLSSATYLTPLYGAIGTGTGTVAVGDTALFTEYSRQTVGAGGYTPASSTVNATTVWQFYFPSFSSSVTITEAGVFANATSTSGSGTLMDHTVLGTPITVPTTDTTILQVSFSVAGS